MTRQPEMVHRAKRSDWGLRIADCGLKRARAGNPQSGTVLIVTIWVVLVLAGLALVFARSIRVTAAVSANHIASLQAESIAAGALEYVVAKLAEQIETQTSVTQTTDLYEAMQVGEGYFWILHSNLESDQELTYGLTDEAGKINLNTASEEMLLNLPGMTAELAASIIDWRDTDSDVTAGGAEDEYYLLQAQPYHCKNGPFETVAEILLVKGASEDLLYGEDTNLNGILDPQENDGDESEPPDNANGQLDRGFYDYVTVYSTEANVDSSGSTRINVGDASARSDLQTLLQETFKEERALEIMGNLSTTATYNSILNFYYSSRLTFEEFSKVADRLTTSSETTLPGLVNVNTAPKEVLMCLPGLEEKDVDDLLAYRGAYALGEEPNSIAWVTEVLDQTKATGIGQYITVHSNQYSADVVALSGNGRAYQRYKAVLDTQQTPPRVTYWRALTHFGWPLDTEIVATLRTGKPLTDTVLSRSTY
ncbi:MAG: type II secretion system protein GspK [Planctomycetes bacterium]|nr:type II secretion system protein GspK [Planctomycetota bacterium]